MVIFMVSSQAGKTKIALNLMGFYIGPDPSPIMYLLPTDGIAEDFSKTRIQANIDATPALKELCGSNIRDGSNTIELKQFPGGYISIHGANTLAKLASKAIRVLLLDEIDRFPDILAKEGDPIKLAIQRTTNYANRVIFFISTPTVEGKSKIEEQFEKSNQQYFHLPCPDCGHGFILEWELVKWELLENGELDERSVYIECPACFHKVTDREKIEMLNHGVWKAQQPEKNNPRVSCQFSLFTMGKFMGIGQRVSGCYQNK